VVGPGYEVALGLLGFLVPNLLLAAELLSIASILAGAVLWVRMLARLSNAWLAFVAALFLVTNVRGDEGARNRHRHSLLKDSPRLTDNDDGGRLSASGMLTEPSPRRGDRNPQEEVDA